MKEYRILGMTVDRYENRHSKMLTGKSKSVFVGQDVHEVISQFQIAIL